MKRCAPSLEVLAHAATKAKHRAARRAGAYLALSLLTFPGVTDREGELEALVARHQVDQIQTSPLAIDPLQYLELARDRGAGGPPLGPRELLRRAAPWLRIGNLSRAFDERLPPGSRSKAAWYAYRTDREAIPRRPGTRIEPIEKPSKATWYAYRTA